MRRLIKIIIRSIWALIISLIFISLINSVEVSAESNLASDFSVSPVTTELNIDPGTSQKGELMINNDTVGVLEINLSAEVFEIINQQYDYAFTEDSDVAGWVRFDEPNFTINSGETKTVAYSISVPITAEPGGRYIGLFVSNDSISEASGAISRQRIASLLYININGNVTKTGRLVSFTTPWLITSDSNWSAAVRNSGTTHFRSRHKTVIYNLFGSKISESDYNETMILPGTVRLISDSISSPTIPGLYKVAYTIGLGDSPAEEVEKYILVLPAYFLSTAASIMVVVALAILYKKIKLRKV